MFLRWCEKCVIRCFSAESSSTHTHTPRHLYWIYCAVLDICFVQHPGNNTQALGISLSHFWNWFYRSFSPELTHYFALLALRLSLSLHTPSPAPAPAPLPYLVHLPRLAEKFGALSLCLGSWFRTENQSQLHILD